MDELLLPKLKCESLRNIPRVNRHCCRMPSRVAVPSIQRCDKGARKGKVRTFEVKIGVNKVFCQAALVLVHQEGSLRREGWSEEKRQRPGRHLSITDYQERDDGCIQWQCGYQERAESSEQRERIPMSP